MTSCVVIIKTVDKEEGEEVEKVGRGRGGGDCICFGSLLPLLKLLNIEHEERDLDQH